MFFILSVSSDDVIFFKIPVVMKIVNIIFVDGI